MKTSSKLGSNFFKSDEQDHKVETILNNTIFL